MKTIEEYIKEIKPVALKFSLHAEAYYSGNEYNEDVIMLISDYEKYIKNNVAVMDCNEYGNDGTVITIPDLDGKYSEVDGFVSVEYITEDDILNGIEADEDGDKLSNYLFNSDDSVKEQVDINYTNYIKGLDIKRELRFKVESSIYEEVKQFLQDMNIDSWKVLLQEKNS